MEPLSVDARIFVGGFSQEVTEAALREHFSKYGRVVHATVANVGRPGRAKDSGFVWFAEEGSAKAAVGDVEEHVILGTKVVVRESDRREQSPISRSNCECIHSDTSGVGNGKKIFVGGLPPDLAQEEFKRYFEAFGETTDVVIIVEPESRRSRGFGFVTYASEESAREVLRNSRYLIGAKDVEVKAAIPKGKAIAPEYPNGLCRVHYGYPQAGMNGYCSKMQAQPYACPAPLYPYALQAPPLYGNGVFLYTAVVATSSQPYNPYSSMLAPSPATSSELGVAPRVDLGATRKFTKIRISKPAARE